MKGSRWESVHPRKQKLNNFHFKKLNKNKNKTKQKKRKEYVILTKNREDPNSDFNYHLRKTLDAFTHIYMLLLSN